MDLVGFGHEIALPRRGHMQRQPPLDCTALRRDLGGHGRRSRHPGDPDRRMGVTPTLMRCTDVGDDPTQIQAAAQRQGMARQCPASTCQRRQAFTERRGQLLGPEVVAITMRSCLREHTARGTEANKAFGFPIRCCCVDTKSGSRRLS
jgi:hypothetical protein